MREQRRGPKAGLAVLVALASLLAVMALGLVAAQEARGATPAEKLAELRVRPEGSTVGYSRDEFPRWSEAQEYGWRLPAGTPDPGSCDVREAALIRDGKDEVVGSGCSVGSERWFDPCTGNTYLQPAEIDIVHIVPLANAWRSGAASWGPVKRELRQRPARRAGGGGRRQPREGRQGPGVVEAAPKGLPLHLLEEVDQHKAPMDALRHPRGESALRQMLSTCR